MSNDKPPSALPIPQSATNNSPRSLGTSILNGAHSGPGSANGSSLSKLNTPTGPPQQHALPNPNIPSPQQQHPQSYSSHGPQFQYGNENPGYMNSQSQPPYSIDFGHQHHLSQGQPPTPQTATSGSNMAFPQPPVLQPNYSQSHHSGFPPFQFPSPNGVSPPAGQPGVSGPMSVHPTQLLPLPQNTQLTPSPSPLTAVSAGGPQTPSSATAVSAGGFSNQPFDTTGQHAPPGMKPRVTATLWEDEGSLCFQVEAKGVCVARREGLYFTYLCFAYHRFC